VKRQLLLNRETNVDLECCLYAWPERVLSGCEGGAFGGAEAIVYSGGVFGGKMLPDERWLFVVSEVNGRSDGDEGDVKRRDREVRLSKQENNE